MAQKALESLENHNEDGTELGPFSLSIRRQIPGALDLVEINDSYLVCSVCLQWRLINVNKSEASSGLNGFEGLCCSPSSL